MSIAKSAETKLCECNQGRLPCTCSTLVPSGGSFSDTNWLAGLRYGLIKLLAGRAVIIVNADIRLQDETPADVLRDVKAEVTVKHGILMHGSDLVCLPGKVIHLRDTYTTRNPEAAR